MSTIKRESANRSAPNHAAKRSNIKQSIKRPNGLETDVVGGREPVHQSPKPKPRAN